MGGKQESAAVQVVTELKQLGCRYCALLVNDPETGAGDVMCRFFELPVLCFIYRDSKFGLMSCPNNITLDQISEIGVK